MLITMLDNVRPEEYGIKGQASWAEAIQWHKGKTYDLDDDLANMFMDNGDAYNAEPEDCYSIWLNSVKPPSHEDLARILRPVPTNPTPAGEV